MFIGNVYSELYWQNESLHQNSSYLEYVNFKGT